MTLTLQGQYLGLSNLLLQSSINFSNGYGWKFFGIDPKKYMKAQFRTINGHVTRQ